jgi:hypothetical protein
MLALITLLRAFCLVGIVSAAPLKDTLGEMIRHRSPGWDEEHHGAHYRRWERIDLGEALEKRDGSAEVVSRLFRTRTGTDMAKRAEGLELEMSIRLMPRDGEKVLDVLRQVNDPSHERFRKFLSHEEAMALVA